MQEKKWKVYKHKVPNEKIYIGITSQDPERRWQNGYGYATQQLFWRAIQKYGWDNIEHNILFENLSFEEAKQIEIELIAKYHTFIHDPLCNGYNMTLGGEGSLGHKVSEKLKEKNRNRILGKKRKRLS